MPKRKAKLIIGEPGPAPKEVKFKQPIVELVEDMKELQVDHNQEKIKKSRPKTTCACGMEISNSGMKRHLEGKKHKEAMSE